MFGRPLSHQQITDGETYSTAYVYNLSGALIEETYPSGRVVRNDLDADGALSRVYGNAVSQTEQTYANSFNYDVNGAVTAMRLGNGKWETAQYNNRQQINADRAWQRCGRHKPSETRIRLRHEQSEQR